jgi:uncharacterized protein DUF3489
LSTEDKVKTNINRATNRSTSTATTAKGKVAKSSQPTKPGVAQVRATRSQGQSKQDRVVAMLRQKEGTTVVAVMKTTGWQKHSVHGFLAGVVRKKLGLTLVSEKSNGERVYRIAKGKRVKASSVA